jgi:hypothetical protein
MVWDVARLHGFEDNEDYLVHLDEWPFSKL